MNTITLKIKDDDNKVVSTRIYNLDELVCATCDGESTDDTSLVLVFSNGDSVRVPSTDKATVLAKLA